MSMLVVTDIVYYIEQLVVCQYVFCCLLFISPFGDGFYNLAYDFLIVNLFFVKYFVLFNRQSEAGLSRPLQRPQT